MNSSRLHVPAPCCRARIEEVLPPPNPFLARLIAQKNADDQFDPNNIQCGLCDDEEAKVACADCNIYSCHDCTKIHLRAPVSKSHRIISIEDALQNPTASPTVCSIHALSLTRFCVTCHIAVCSDCALDGHSGHDNAHKIARLCEVASMLRKELAGLIPGLFRAEKRLTDSIEERRIALDQLDSRAQQANEQIRKEKKILEDEMNDQVLSTNEEELLTQVKLRTLSQRKNLRFGKEDLEFTLQGVRASHTFGATLLSAGNDAEIANNQVDFKFATEPSLAFRKR